jgi:hypothetical protein
MEILQLFQEKETVQRFSEFPFAACLLISISLVVTHQYRRFAKPLLEKS